MAIRQAFDTLGAVELFRTKDLFISLFSWIRFNIPCFVKNSVFERTKCTPVARGGLSLTSAFETCSTQCNILFFFFCSLPLRFIVWRKANQISMKLAVQPAPDCKPGDEVVIGFSLQYTYVSTAMDKNVTAASTTAGGTPGSGSSGAASAAATAATPGSTSTPTKGGPQKHALTTRVYLKLGRIAAVPEVAA